MSDDVFSLTCGDCDAGMDIDTVQQAILQGWGDLEPVDDCPTATWLGICPDCIAEGARPARMGLMEQAT